MEPFLETSAHRPLFCIERLDRLNFLLVFLCLLPVAGWSQERLKVEVCDLVREPEKYTGQWINVRGKVNIGLEDFTLETHDCGEDLQEIWLAYGGDEPTPVISTVNDQSREPGSILLFGDIPVPLEHDAELDLFKGRLEARRLRTLAGSWCQTCRLYNLTASFYGLFLAASSRPEEFLRGYGHLECCHLFVMEKITGVEAVRTEIPAGGRFVCSTDSWELDDTAEAATEERECSDWRDCDQARRESLRVLAEHWHDKVNLDKGDLANWEWISPDLLITYRLIRPDQDTGKSEAHAAAQRTVCKPAEAPYPLSTPVRCKALYSEFNTSKKEIAEAEHWNGKLEEVSRLALEEAARRWGVQLMAGLSPIKCSSPAMFEGDQSMWCEWREPTAMQEFTIRISRSHFLRKGQEWNKVPWTLVNGTGTACEAETR